MEGDPPQRVRLLIGHRTKFKVGRGGVLEGVETALRRGLVDIALCWVMSDAGLRRSEAAALVWDDITRWDNGSGRLTVRRSKTDAAPRTGYLTPVAIIPGVSVFMWTRYRMVPCSKIAKRICLGFVGHLSSSHRPAAATPTAGA